jgi:hypothetical protein
VTVTRTPVTSWIRVGLCACQPTACWIIVLGLLLAVSGNVLLSLAIWRSATLPRWTAVIWAAATMIFYVLGAALGMATTGASLPTQPIGAAFMAVAGAGIAWAASRRRAVNSFGSPTSGPTSGIGYTLAARNSTSSPRTPIRLPRSGLPTSLLPPQE